MQLLTEHAIIDKNICVIRDNMFSYNGQLRIPQVLNLYII